MSMEIVIWFVPASVWRLILPEVRVTECSQRSGLSLNFHLSLRERVGAESGV